MGYHINSLRNTSDIWAITIASRKSSTPPYLQVFYVGAKYGRWGQTVTYKGEDIYAFIRRIKKNELSERCSNAIAMAFPPKPYIVRRSLSLSTAGSSALPRSKQSRAGYEVTINHNREQAVRHIQRALLNSGWPDKYLQRLTQKANKMALKSPLEHPTLSDDRCLMRCILEHHHQPEINKIAFFAVQGRYDVIAQNASTTNFDRKDFSFLLLAALDQNLITKYQYLSSVMVIQACDLFGVRSLQRHNLLKGEGPLRLSDYWGMSTQNITKLESILEEEQQEKHYYTFKIDPQRFLASIFMYNKVYPHGYGSMNCSFFANTNLGEILQLLIKHNSAEIPDINERSKIRLLEQLGLLSCGEQCDEKILCQILDPILAPSQQAFKDDTSDIIFLFELNRNVQRLLPMFIYDTSNWCVKLVYFPTDVFNAYATAAFGDYAVEPEVLVQPDLGVKHIRVLADEIRFFNGMLCNSDGSELSAAQKAGLAVYVRQFNASLKNKYILKIDPKGNPVLYLVNRREDGSHVLTASDLSALEGKIIFPASRPVQVYQKSLMPSTIYKPHNSSDCCYAGVFHDLFHTIVCSSISYSMGGLFQRLRSIHDTLGGLRSALGTRISTTYIYFLSDMDVRSPNVHTKNSLTTQKMFEVILRDGGLGKYLELYDSHTSTACLYNNLLCYDIHKNPLIWNKMLPGQFGDGLQYTTFNEWRDDNTAAEVYRLNSRLMEKVIARDRDATFLECHISRVYLKYGYQLDNERPFLECIRAFGNSLFTFKPVLSNTWRSINSAGLYVNKTPIKNLSLMELKNEVYKCLFVQSPLTVFEQALSLNAKIELLSYLSSTNTFTEIDKGNKLAIFQSIHQNIADVFMRHLDTLVALTIDKPSELCELFLKAIKDTTATSPFTNFDLFISLVERNLLSSGGEAAIETLLEGLNETQESQSRHQNIADVFMRNLDTLVALTIDKPSELCELFLKAIEEAATATSAFTNFDLFILLVERNLLSGDGEAAIERLLGSLDETEKSQSIKNHEEKLNSITLDQRYMVLFHASPRLEYHFSVHSGPSHNNASCQAVAESVQHNTSTVHAVCGH